MANVGNRPTYAYLPEETTMDFRRSALGCMALAFCLGTLSACASTQALAPGQLAPALVAQLDATEVHLKYFRTSLDLYRLDANQYPSQTDGLDALINTGLMVKEQKDPWGNSYVYRSNGTAYRIFSCGPDGVAYTADDVEI